VQTMHHLTGCAFAIHWQMAAMPTKQPTCAIGQWKPACSPSKSTIVDQRTAWSQQLSFDAVGEITVMCFKLQSNSVIIAELVSVNGQTVGNCPRHSASTVLLSQSFRAMSLATTVRWSCVSTPSTEHH
jgi:hypothetical protein